MRAVQGLPLALAALLLSSACVYGGATGYAPTDYPADYDSGMGSGLVSQPGDLFGSQNVASVAVFEAPLAPYGEWVNSRFGRAFRPDVDREWRPYVNGQWGENRTWISNDPWGWATDHYGRWGFDEQIGWLWVPGTEWAPSWVAFRDDPAQNVSGWAPIPPNVNYSLSLGFGNGFGYDNFNSWYAPSWVWVPRGFVYQPGFGGRVLPWRYGATYWGGSRWQPQPGWGGRPPIGGGAGFRRPGGDWQARQPVNRQFRGAPPQDGQFRGVPPQDGQFRGVPPQGGQFEGRPWRQGRVGGLRNDGVRGDGGVTEQLRRERQAGTDYRRSQAEPGDPPMAAVPRNRQAMPRDRQAMAGPSGVGDVPQRQMPVAMAPQPSRPAPPPQRPERPSRPAEAPSNRRGQENVQPQ